MIQFWQFVSPFAKSLFLTVIHKVKTGLYCISRICVLLIFVLFSLLTFLICPHTPSSLSSGVVCLLSVLVDLCCYNRVTGWVIRRKRIYFHSSEGWWRRVLTWQKGREEPTPSSSFYSTINPLVTSSHSDPAPNAVTLRMEFPAQELWRWQDHSSHGGCPCFKGPLVICIWSQLWLFKVCVCSLLCPVMSFWWGRGCVTGPVPSWVHYGEEGEHATAFSEPSFSSAPAQLSGPGWPELDVGGA